jgi:hypothetical protein
MTDHDELRRLAQAATPGPWTSTGFRVSDTTVAKYLTARTETHADAAFIAAANPATVIALLDERDELLGALNDQCDWGNAVAQLDAARADLAAANARLVRCTCGASDA